MKPCKLCQDRGVIISNQVAVPCSCNRQRALFNRFKNAGLPDGLRECTFERFDFRYYSKQLMDPVHKTTYYDLARRAFRAAENFVRQFVQDPHIDGLLISGPVGSGKTFLAACMANALLQEEVPLLFVVVPDLLDQLRATYNQDRQPTGYTEKDLMDAAREVSLLILDDLGAHNYTEWTKNRLYSILNYRLNYRLPVIITTNLSLEKLDEYLGERTTSRICQMCWPCHLAVVDDIRMVRRKERLQEK
ncbi:MAG: ATP-binding protein [Thermoanaerobacteraceae bacterium]|nr:ATP-binding protein [Thermoanaerobacteraceae bacterium]